MSWERGARERRHMSAIRTLKKYFKRVIELPEPRMNTTNNTRKKGEWEEREQWRELKNGYKINTKRARSNKLDGGGEDNEWKNKLLSMSQDVLWNHREGERKISTRHAFVSDIVWCDIVDSIYYCAIKNHSKTGWLSLSPYKHGTAWVNVIFRTADTTRIWIISIEWHIYVSRIFFCQFCAQNGRSEAWSLNEVWKYLSMSIGN